MAGRRQGIYWLLTIPFPLFTPWLPPTCAFIRGQLEIGAGETGYLHWQVLVGLLKKGSLGKIKEIFGEGIHAEISRTDATTAYVWKEETRVAGTQFELGSRPFKRNDPRDWDEIWELAAKGDISSIPSSIRVLHYRTLRAIGADFAKPVPMVRTCHVFWGTTGTGKSRDSWAAAGVEGYSKDPNTKFWCGYSGQRNVIIDEFRGRIDVSHLLRWLDRYPVSVEIKGSSVPLLAEQFWITSNVDPRYWYPELDQETLSALLRRFNITHYHYLNSIRLIILRPKPSLRPAVPSRGPVDPWRV